LTTGQTPSHSEGSSNSTDQIYYRLFYFFTHDN
jgi:hypothetical protein